jgi:hypothetical protein
MSKIKWTKEICINEALKYNTRYEFERKSTNCYKAAYSKKWLDEICSHMELHFKPDGYWTKEHCAEVALLCNTRTDFYKKYNHPYNISRNNGWMEEICSHMIYPDIDGKLWIIYSYIILDKYVYIGLTDNEKRRKNEHKRNNYNNNSAVKKFINKNNIQEKDVQYYIEVENIIKPNIAKLFEKIYLDLYIKEGYEKLNIAKPGNLGGSKVFWTKEKCKECADLCDSYREFRKKFKNAYDAALKRGWLTEICHHLEKVNTFPKGYWTKEKCYEEALKYDNISIFQKNSPSAYGAALRNSWIKEICSHMIQKYKPKNYWTKEKCYELAQTCTTNEEFKNKSISAYEKTIRCGWKKDVCSHFIIIRKPNGYWNIKEHCLEAALKCNIRTEFDEKYKIAYEIASKNCWLDEICSHMIKTTNLKGYWSKENCHIEALKYNKKSDFIINSKGAYKAALKNKWIDEICNHMIIYQRNKWTYEECYTESKKYNSKKEFEMYSSGAYHAAWKNKWLNDFFPKKSG